MQLIGLSKVVRTIKASYKLQKSMVLPVSILHSHSAVSLHCSKARRNELDIVNSTLLQRWRYCKCNQD